MKYLKLFENVKYFSEIQSLGFSMACDSGSENFTDSELYSIKSLLGDADYRLEEANYFEGKNFKSKLLVYWIDTLGPPAYIIAKLRDEWFVVQSYSEKWINTAFTLARSNTYKYYKCDQLEGLLACIKKSQSN